MPVSLWPCRLVHGSNCSWLFPMLCPSAQRHLSCLCPSSPQWSWLECLEFLVLLFRCSPAAVWSLCRLWASLAGTGTTPMGVGWIDVPRFKAHGGRCSSPSLTDGPHQPQLIRFLSDSPMLWSSRILGCGTSPVTNHLICHTQLALSDPFPLNRRTNEKLPALQSPWPLLPVLCNPSYSRLLLAVSQCPHETTGNNSRLQSVDVRALVVSWWHFWYKHLHHTSGACIRSANGCSITLRRESPPSALPLCTSFELLWLLYREQIGQPYSSTESLLMFGELKLDFLCQKALRTASLLCFTKWKSKKQYS